MPGDPRRVIAELRELARLTSDTRGAQRVAWTDGWRTARAWFADRVRALGREPAADAAGNVWVVLPGRSARAIVLGSHLDSVPNGGWLDGPLGLLAALEALRIYGSATPPVTLQLVDWADEEGRFGLSLLGSSAAADLVDLDAARRAADRDGVRLVDALAGHGVVLDRMPDAHQALRAIDARAYLELHIEQGPVLASLGAPAGAVAGTFGVERYRLGFVGQAAHSGSTPLHLRQDAFLAAAETAIECRAIARRAVGRGAAAVATTGAVAVQPNIPTAIAGACEMSLDLRALDVGDLAGLLAEARAAAARAAAANRVAVDWRLLWRIAPRPFDAALIRLCEDAIRDETGVAPRLPSGPVHDATMMAALMPAVMMFAASPNGLSHCREEDTPEPILEQAIGAYLRLVGKTIQHVAALA